MKVEIKTEYLKKLPLEGLPSRLVTALVLAYVDVKEWVICLLLRLSHKTRAYIYNEKGLKGFLIEYELLGALQRPGLEVAMRW